MCLKQIAACIPVMVFSWQLHAETTVIQGSAPGASSLPVELITYSDYVSNTERTLTQSTVSANDTFEIVAEIQQTTFTMLKIGIQKCEILLEPGRQYHLKITGILSEKFRDKDIAPFQIPWLHYELLNPWQFELNRLVSDFFTFHDQFLAENSMALLRSNGAVLAKKYIQELYNRFPGIDNAWFNDLLTYKTASIEMMSKALNRNSLAEKYLLSNEVLYDHMEYMDFFRQFFEKYLLTYPAYDRRSIITALESPNSHHMMMEMLGKDTILKDNRLRELVLIRGMFDLSGTPGFDTDRINRLLQQVQTGSKYREHQLIAGNLIRLISTH